MLSVVSHGIPGTDMARALPLSPLVLLAGAMFSLPAHAADRFEKRCGWFVNVTPGNFELDDRDGEWTIAQQGGYEAAGLDNLPDMAAQGWVATNGPHGHACACMKVTTDRDSMLITRFLSATPRPLRLCRSDTHLPKP